MKKVIYGIALGLCFLGGFLLCFVLHADRHKGMEYSIINDMENFNALLSGDTAEFAILDLRKAEDFEKSHLKKSINIPYEEETFLQKFAESEIENIPIYLLCYSGKMSAKAFQQMTAQGIDNIHYVSFGYDDYLNFLIPDSQSESMELSYQDAFPPLYLGEHGKNVAELLEGVSYTMVAYVSNECVSYKEALADMSLTKLVEATNGHFPVEATNEI